MISQSCFPSQIDIFADVSYQSGILNYENQTFSPITTLENTNVIEFNIAASPDHYIDLSSIYLELKVQFLKSSGEKFSAKSTNDAKGDEKGVQPALVCNSLSSLFRTCTVYFNNKRVSFIDLYHYQDYITKILNYDSNCISTKLGLDGFILDTAGEMSKMDSSNMGHSHRRELMINSKEHTFITRLNMDVFNIERFLCNNIDVRITLGLENPNFFVMEKSVEGSESILKINQAKLNVKRYILSPDVLLAHSRYLQSGVSAIYPYRRREMKTFTITPNVYVHTFDNIFQGRMPNNIAFAITPATNYNGKRDKNPYDFQNVNVTSYGVFINNTCVSKTPLEIDFKNNDTAKGYFQLLDGIGKLNNDTANSITQKDFANGFCMLAWNFTPSQTFLDGECMDRPTTGTLKIEVKFESAPQFTLTLILFAEFESCFFVNKNYEISLLD